MESQLEEGRTRAKRKMPDLEASLDSIAMLRKKKVGPARARVFFMLLLPNAVRVPPFESWCATPSPS